jgi:hypothetical protein
MWQGSLVSTSLLMADGSCSGSFAGCGKLITLSVWDVEWLFYFDMFLRYGLRWLSLIHQMMLRLLLDLIIYFDQKCWFSISLPWTIFRLMILQYLPWFALGIAIYQASRRQEAPSRRWSTITAICAIPTLAGIESIAVGLLFVVSALLVRLAAAGRLLCCVIGPLCGFASFLTGCICCMKISTGAVNSSWVPWGFRPPPLPWSR